MHKTDRIIEKKVAEQGFVVLYLLDSDLAYGYTVGLSQYGLPDIVLTGFSQENTLSFLNIVARYLVEKKQYALNSAIEGLFNMPVAFMPLKTEVDKDTYFCRKFEFDENHQRNTDLVTVVFGDAAGKLLGEKGCDNGWFDKTAAFSALVN